MILYSKVEFSKKKIKKIKVLGKVVIWRKWNTEEGKEVLLFAIYFAVYFMSYTDNLRKDTGRSSSNYLEENEPRDPAVLADCSGCTRFSVCNSRKVTKWGRGYRFSHFEWLYTCFLTSLSLSFLAYRDTEDDYVIVWPFPHRWTSLVYMYMQCCEHIRFKGINWSENKLHC